ncbi:MAG: hypothetical protein HS129_12385 [Leptospiraceae bacterium]|nr:hypothetical protein [Leptospiraceae bacterium]
MEKTENTPISKCIVGSLLSDIEFQLLSSLVKYHGFNLIPFSAVKNIHPINHDLTYIPNCDYKTIQELLNWSIEISVIGRLSSQQKLDLQELGVIQFWDLDKFSLTEFPVCISNKNTPDLLPCIMIFTSDILFRKKLHSLLRLFQIHLMNSNTLPEFTFLIQNKKPDIIILDWDNENTEIGNIADSLKHIENKFTKTPLIVGIKDTHSLNLFSDLSKIKEFCKILFSKKEVLEILLNSLPVEFDSQATTVERNCINWNFLKSQNPSSFILEKKELSTTRQNFESLKNLYFWLLE